jgi:hypothetical protein
MSLFSIKDSNGQKSSTLALIWLPVLALTAAFLWNTYQGAQPDYFSYGGAVGTLIFAWLGRKGIDAFSAGLISKQK